MAKEKINVILCCYQGEAYIAEQLDSILAQTYTSVEIHVFDDCSFDKTCAIVNIYSKNFSNITLYRNSENLGFVRNFEASLKTVKEKYIALCDQDDIWDSNKLTLSMQLLQSLEVKYPDKPILIHSDLELIDSEGSTIESSFFTKKGLSFIEEKSLAKMIGHCGVMGNTILMNRNLIEKALPFPVHLKYHDYWLALINECFGKRGTIEKPLVKYRLHNTNTSNNNIVANRAKTLPFMQDDRITTIKYLLGNYDLKAEDKYLIERFYEYLAFGKNRFSDFVFLFKNDFFKPSFLYRVNSFFKIMLSAYKQ